MYKALLLPAFLMLCLAQWLIPSRMIWSKEKVLARGKLFKFRTAPIDPVDAFRGRYIILNYSADLFAMRGKTTITSGSNVYAVFSNDPAGFARIESISEKKPAQPYFLQTTVDYVQEQKDSSVIAVQLPFYRFYMEESKAPRAEAVYRDRNLDTAQRTYALVSILDGDAVIKNVFVNDSSIADIIAHSFK